MRTVRLAAAALACSCIAVPTPVSAEPLSGFGSAATATPLKIEVYEPTIPIPATPQAELSQDYSHVEASSGPAGRALASALWPGDAVGGGFATFGQALGLPEAVYADGYQVQANATYPSDQTEQRNEPLPGSVQRVSSGADKTVAKAAFDSSGDSAEEESGDDPAADPGEPGGLPDLPGLPQGPAKQRAGSTKAAADDPDPQNPLGALASVVSAGGMNSVSSTTYGGADVVATAVSRVSNLNLAGGLVHIDGVKVLTRSTADLSKARSTYEVAYTGMSIAGTPVSVTKGGVKASDQGADIPGLPDDPNKALAMLGIAIELPQAERKDTGLSTALAIQGLRITVDTHQLRAALKDVPLGDLVGAIPDEAGQLKSVLGALATATPKIVVYLGNARSSATAIEPLELAPIDTGAAAGAPPAAPGPAGAGPLGGATGGAGSSAAPIESVGGAPSAGGTVEDAVDLASTPGLPPLGGIPSLLLFGGILLGAVVGQWLRKGGLIILGSSSTCDHGLAGGLPELRQIGTTS